MVSAFQCCYPDNACRRGAGISLGKKFLSLLPPPLFAVQLRRRDEGCAGETILENVMKQRVRWAVLLTLGLGVAEWAALHAADADVKKDEARPEVAADEDLVKRS